MGQWLSEEDGAALQPSCGVRPSNLDLRALRVWPGVRRAGLSRLSDGADSRPAAPQAPRLLDTYGQIRQHEWPLRPEAKYRRGLPAPQHAWPAADRPCVSAGVHRCRWRLSLTSSLGRSRSGRERLLSPTRFPSLRDWVRGTSRGYVTSVACPAWSTPNVSGRS